MPTIVRQVVLLLAATLGAVPAVAQEYRFRVPKVQMVTTIQPDASVRIAYEFQFQNAPGAHPIDVVDIGTPHAGYKLDNVEASIDGHPLHDIRVSTYVKPGFEVHLAPRVIAPGGSGRLRVEFTMPNTVFQDTTRKDYASFRITPTWFGERYVLGTTHLQVAVQLPQSVQPDEVLHQGLPFWRKALTRQGALVGWDFPRARLTGPHQVALSFPKRDMQRVVQQTAIDLLVKWFSESPRVRFFMGSVFMVLWGVLFFRFSGGTGFSVYFFVAILTGVLFVFSPGAHLLAMPIVVALIGLNEWFLSRRKLHYMPPIAQIEGGGIKRGLTAPEAAVLLELPIAKVLSLVIFGMLKKGILRQVSAEPLTVEIVEAFRIPGEPALMKDEDRTAFYNAAAVKHRTVVNAYEHPFLLLLQTHSGTPVKDINFGIPVKLLIQSAAARLSGFDLKQTQDYYRSIIRRAADQAATIGDIPQREKTIDRNFEWILMGDGYGPVFDYGRPYRPVWTRGSSTSFPSGGGTPEPTANLPGGTSFTDVAASFSGWAENTMGDLASSIAPGSLTMERPGGGFFDLSGVDHVTGEFFKAVAESAASGGGGGGGGCACAGCACACACAGGGR